MIKELLHRLYDVPGPTGGEEAVRQQLTDLLGPSVDELSIDSLGNLYAVVRPKETSHGVILLTAPMDEPALVVIDDRERPFLRVETSGRLAASAWIGRTVLCSRTGARGIVGVEGEVKPGEVTAHHLFIDLITDREQPELGDFFTTVSPLVWHDKRYVSGPALTSRVPCAILSDILLRSATSYTIVGVFAAQSELGARGARVAGHAVKADLALTIQTTQALDTPKAERGTVKLGGGTAVKEADRDMVVAPRIRKALTDTARAASIAYQTEINLTSHSDTGALFLSRDGMPAGGVSVPVRYPDALSPLMDWNDVRATRDLLLSLLHQPEFIKTL
ncbi:hypothetical protein [Ferroacidibacillus organovorans]|uniref:Peptidase M42 n=1 Tax=Ferroacidibacillus organovorans TaxID=1765683 RepID=A0A101XSR2_9BACL|nr:hypothetical protein [Ferroacidibacillus organovorans]KUO96863.1 hypothetical protein ATW55_08635 [Ferroacidibacillus organovorans]